MIIYGTDHRIRGRTPADSIGTSIVEMPSGGSVTNTPQTWNDINYIYRESVDSQPNYQIIVTLPAGDDGPIVYTSLAPAVATVDQSGFVTYQSDGLSEIQVETEKSGVVIVRHELVMSGTTTITVHPETFVSGTLGADVTAAIGAMADASAAGDANQEMWTSNNKDPGAPAATINGTLFTTIDHTPFSVITEGRDDRFPVAVISEKHFICSQHVRPAAGARLAFTWDDGTSWQTVTVKETRNIAVEDTSIGVINETFDAQITRVKVPPSNFLDYVPSVDVRRWQAEVDSRITFANGALLSLRKSMHNRQGANMSWVSIECMHQYGSQPNNFYNSNYRYGTPTPSTFNRADLENWRATAIGGDSGGWFVIPTADGDVLIAMAHTATSAPLYPEIIDDINAAMNALDNTQAWAVQEADFSGYTVFP